MSVFTLRNAIRDSALARREYAVMMTAASYDDGDGIVTISKETLALKSRYSRTEVYEALKTLSSLGWCQPIKHPHRPRAKALRLTVGRCPDESENRTTQPSENRTSPKTGQVGSPDLSGHRTRGVRKPDNSPTPPIKEEQTREQTRASKQAARTYEAPQSVASSTSVELPARSLPPVDFPTKPGPPLADYDVALLDECRREWNEAHTDARITSRFAMGARWIQTHFGPLTLGQRREVWDSFRRRLVDGSLRTPERWLRSACLGKAQDGPKVVRMSKGRGRQRSTPEQPDWEYDVDLLPDDFLEAIS